MKRVKCARRMRIYKMLIRACQFSYSLSVLYFCSRAQSLKAKVCKKIENHIKLNKKKLFEFT